MTRCGWLVLATCLIAVGCGDDSTTGPSTAPLVFTADLRPANEVPPVGNAESGGFGAVQVSVDQTAGTASFYFQLTGFPSGTRVQGAHIHSAGPGINGPIVVDTRLTAASPLVLSERITDFSVTGVAVSAGTLQGLINNPAAFYFNVHSPLNPGGFARGQLVRTQ
jgi:hypothetical protein